MPALELDSLCESLFFLRVLSLVACVGSTKVLHLKTAVVKLRLTHSLAAVVPKMFSFLPFIFDLL